MKKQKYPFISHLPERARKQGTKCKCCKGKIDKNGHCICKTVLD